MEPPATSVSDPTEPVAAHDITTQSGAQQIRVEFDDFYGNHVAAIGRALEITLGDLELAEDAVNEAMARALQRWNRVSRFDNPAGWVYRVAVNWALSWKRRRRRERERPIVFTPITAEIPLGDETLRAAIENLSLEHRSVVVCRYYLDWSTAHTATALAIAEGTVKSRLARALDSIRSFMETQGAPAQALPAPVREDQQ